ncbi:MAG: WD40/YVTN/BNR-like repeat-containing protein [Sandaracinaceae bacterium]
MTDDDEADVGSGPPEDEEERPSIDELALDAIEVGEDEEIGLDTTVGLDEDVGPVELDLPPEEAAAEGDGIDEEPVGVDELGEGGGWIDDGQDDDREWTAEELDLVPLTALGHDDGGAEGLEEHRPGVGDDDLPAGLRPLPPLDAATDDDDEPASSRREDAGWLSDRLRGGGEASTVAAAFAVREDAQDVRRLHDEPALAFDLGPPLVTIGATLRVGDGAPSEPTGLDPAADLRVAVAVDVRDPRRIAVAARRGGVYGSEDGGLTVARSRSASGRASAGVRGMVREGARLWARTRTGGLLRSDDHGRTWSGPLMLAPVVALAVPAEGAVLVLTAAQDGPSQLARSDDGGARWTAVEGPRLGAEAASAGVALGVVQDAVAVNVIGDRSGPWLSRRRGRGWFRAPGLPAVGQLALCREPGGLTLYTVHPRGERGDVLCRHRLDGGDATLLLDVAAEALAREVDPGLAGGARVITQLSAERRGGTTTVHAATSIGLFRVEVAVD